METSWCNGLPKSMVGCLKVYLAVNICSANDSKEKFPFIIPLILQVGFNCKIDCFVL